MSNEQSLESVKIRYEETKDNDPFPKVAPALLNKWDIINYVNKVGLIFPFFEKDLKGITYDARLSGECVFWDYDIKSKKRRINRITLSKEGDKLILKPNTIVFVTLQPYFQVPNYIALRYNFKISNIYKGLLLGTGPIIDPGFTGYLSIPIHNLTDNTYELHFNEPLISIEFTKINPYKLSIYKEVPPEEFQKTKSFSARTVENYIDEALKNSQGTTSEDFGVVNSVPAIKDAIGSFEKEQNNLNEFKEQTTETVNKHKQEVELKLDKSKKYSIIGAVITFVLTLAGLFLPIIIELDAIQKERSEYNREIIYLKESLKSSQDELSDLLIRYENLLKLAETDTTEIENLKLQIEELKKEITKQQSQLEDFGALNNNG